MVYVFPRQLLWHSDYKIALRALAQFRFFYQTVLGKTFIISTIFITFLQMRYHWKAQNLSYTIRLFWYSFFRYPRFSTTLNLSSKRSSQGHKGQEILKLTTDNFDKCHKVYQCQILSFYHNWLCFYAIFCDFA